MEIINRYTNLKSFISLARQLPVFCKDLEVLMKKYKNGINLIGYSQGGLLARGALQTLDHNVENFITLSSPLNGQFGETDFIRELLPHTKFTKYTLWKYFYSKTVRTFFGTI